ncbi:MAG TPA: hypothetical protein VEG38_08415, partial [Acidimicrobiia bacterium]|nr:hypothetical protein [Acidimicrobiia bacterium]
MIRRRPMLFVIGVAAGLTLAGLPSGEALYRTHDGVVAAEPAKNTPHVLDGKVLAILPMGNRVYVGGTFTKVSMSPSSTPPADEVFASPGLFALDPATNRIDTAFRPALAGVDPAAGIGVQALAPAPGHGSLFVGGDFAGAKVLRLDAASGAVVPGFNAGIHTAVKDLAIHGDRLFAAGIFETPRAGLAALDVHSGAALDNLNVSFTNPRMGNRPRVESIALSPDGSTLVAGGNFTKVDGHERWQMALLDVTPGRPAAVLDWHTDRFNDNVVSDRPEDVPACAEAFDAHIKDLDMSPDGSYFVVVTTGGYTRRGPLCDTASRWETAARGSHLQPTWAQYVGGDTLTGVTASGSAVYVSGHPRWFNNYFNDGSASDALPGDGSVEREGIAALDPASGLPLPWNPRRERGHGAEALVTSEHGLWVGSDSDRIGHRDFDGSPRSGEVHRKLAFFPLAGGAPAASSAVTALPTDLYRFSDSGLEIRAFDGAGLGPARTVAGDWSGVRGAFAIGDRVYTGTADGTLVRYTLDGTSLTQPRTVDLRGLDRRDKARFTRSAISKITGMFFADGRIYYTRAGEPALFYRSFLSQPNVADDVVGDQEFTAGGSYDWSDIDGMTHAAGQIYFSKSGDLFRIGLEGGPDGHRRPTGSPVLVQAGAGLDGRGLFLCCRMGSAVPAPPASPAPPPPPAPGGPGDGGSSAGRSGYWMVGSDGRVYAFGDAPHLGDATQFLGGIAAADLEPTPSGGGYWIVDETGRVFAFGDARSLGNAPPAQLVPGERVTSLSATRDGAGYWLFTNRGRAMAFGDAGSHGDVSAVKLNGPVLDSIPTPSGNGYYMVASDGGIFAFGDARFFGSMGGTRLNAPVQSLVPDPDGTGYWLVASD